MNTFPPYRAGFWLAVTAVTVPNRKAGVLAHHDNIKNINSGLVTVQFPGVLLKTGRKKRIYVKHAHLMSPMTWSGKDSSGCWKKPGLRHSTEICSLELNFKASSKVSPNKCQIICYFWKQKLSVIFWHLSRIWYSQLIKSSVKPRTSASNGWCISTRGLVLSLLQLRPSP